MTIVAIIAVALITVLTLYGTRLRRKIEQLDWQLLRQAESIRNCEQQRELAVHYTPISHVVVDRKTLRFQTVNIAAIEQYGYSREEFLKMSLADIRPKEDVPALSGSPGK